MAIHENDQSSALSSVNNVPANFEGIFSIPIDKVKRTPEKFEDTKYEPMNNLSNPFISMATNNNNAPARLMNNNNNNNNNNTSRPIQLDGLKQSINQRESNNIRENGASYRHHMDPETDVGYIPPTPRDISSDYLRQHALNMDKEMREYQTRKYRASAMIEALDVIQIPIIVSIIFYIFNSSYTHSILFHFLPSSGMFKETGEYSTMGLLIKSMIFGIVYFLLIFGVEYFSGM